jgi:hypothetical protein
MNSGEQEAYIFIIEKPILSRQFRVAVMDGD